jgi:hypothetical protein
MSFSLPNIDFLFFLDEVVPTLLDIGELDVLPGDPDDGNACPLTDVEGLPDSTDAVGTAGETSGSVAGTEGTDVVPSVGAIESGRARADVTDSSG